MTEWQTADTEQLDNMNEGLLDRAAALTNDPRSAARLALTAIRIQRVLLRRDAVAGSMSDLSVTLGWLAQAQMAAAEAIERGAPPPAPERAHELPPRARVLYSAAARNALLSGRINLEMALGYERATDPGVQALRAVLPNAFPTVVHYEQAEARLRLAEQALARLGPGRAMDAARARGLADSAERSRDELRAGLHQPPPPEPASAAALLDRGHRHAEEAEGLRDLGLRASDSAVGAATRHARAARDALWQALQEHESPEAIVALLGNVAAAQGSLADAWRDAGNPVLSRLYSTWTLHHANFARDWSAALAEGRRAVGDEQAALEHNELAVNLRLYAATVLDQLGDPRAPRELAEAEAEHNRLRATRHPSPPGATGLER
jgi:hypothetical protein